MNSSGNFTAEWYSTPDGKTPPLEDLKKLRKGAGPQAIKRVLARVDMLETLGFAGGTDLTHKVRGDVWELLATWKNNPYRILFYNPDGRIFVLLHFFHKKTDAILASDIATAERRMAEDRTRRGRS